MTLRRRIHLAAAVVAGTLALAATATAALVGLPADGSQVNDDPAHGIDPARSAGLSDVQGGTVVPGNVQVPWAAFEQKGGSPSPRAQQIFVRAFKGGQWVTQGDSLNIDRSVEAEAPSIDFAGSGRTVPWVAWYEPNATLGGAKQIFASRFSAAANAWLPSGQDRSAGGALPSLNIHTANDAENPAVAGGAAIAGADPVPWVAWQEQDGASRTDQIFVSRAVKQAAAGTACTGFAPGSGPNVNGFCWQQVGLGRLAATGRSSASGDPTLSIDPTRDAVEPDDAFAGASDTVPWVVWYEQHPGSIPGLHANDMVFAARAVQVAPGVFHWIAIGNGTKGQTTENLLDTSGANGFGNCAASAQNEAACSLNADAGADAQDPRVAAGSLAPNSPTVPWVVWAEKHDGHDAIFVSRLVGGDHFELFNGGAPISSPGRDAASPDITFSGHTPVISWLETVDGTRRAFVGHFEGGAAAPVFHLDTPSDGMPAGPDGVADARAPISSTCTANPTNADGTTCQAGAVGTPFFLVGDLDRSVERLHARAVVARDVVTAAATGVGPGSATLNATADPDGAPVEVRFEYGLTTAYGSSTAPQRLGPSFGEAPFSALLSGLPAGATIHYRAVARSDFGTLTGADRTLTTALAGGGNGGAAALRVSLGKLPSRIALHHLRRRALALRIVLSRDAGLTIDLRRGAHRVLRLALQRPAGSSTVTLGLRHLRPGRYVLRLEARDSAGVTASVTRLLRLAR